MLLTVLLTEPVNARASAVPAVAQVTSAPRGANAALARPVAKLSGPAPAPALCGLQGGRRVRNKIVYTSKQHQHHQRK